MALRILRGAFFVNAAYKVSGPNLPGSGLTPVFAGIPGVGLASDFRRTLWVYLA
jgi:hypothetical protein